jgi:hypothetical protein
MDLWFKVGTISAVLQAAFAGATFFGFTSQHMTDNYLSIFVIMGLAIFTWLALYLSYREMRRVSTQEKGGSGQAIIAQSGISHGYDDLIISYAGYGLTFGNYRDVTERVRGLVKDGKLHIRVGHDSLQCDPYRGMSKHLFVIYTYKNAEGKTIQVGDDKILQLPPP